MATFSIWGNGRAGSPTSKSRRFRKSNMPQVFGQALSRNQFQTFLGVILFLLTGYLLLSHVSPLAQESKALPDDEPSYGIMFDAGSSGSRVHVYEFRKNGDELSLVDEFFEMISPGLSAFAGSDKDILESADKNIKPLLEKAIAKVPRKYQPSSPVVLRATAGLRKIGAEKADRLLEQVRILFRNSPFLFREDSWVSMMSGEDEGAYAWVTVNYLRKLLGKSPAQTSGVLDLGGGSTQIAFAVTDEEASMARSQVQTRKFGATTYNIYINSYLGYGLNEARTSVLSAKNTYKGICLPPSYKGLWQGLELEGSTDVTEGHQNRCATQVLSTLFPATQCDVDHCAIKGVPQPSVTSRDFHAFSYYYDRAVDVGLVKETDLDPVLNPRHYKNTAKKVCPMSHSQIAGEFVVAK
eukprot:Ihof_evm19s24 gene=Ihof_evmTU19s24